MTLPTERSMSNADMRLGNSFRISHKRSHTRTWTRQLKRAVTAVNRRNGFDTKDFAFDIPENFKALDSRGVRAELGKMRDVANSIAADMDRLYEKQKDAKNRSDAR